MIRIFTVIILIIAFSLDMDSQSSAHYELTYNDDNCKYEVWCNVGGGNTTAFPNDSGALSVGLVLPGQYSNGAITNIISNEPGTASWSIGSTCYSDDLGNLPAIEDYYHITMGGDVFTTFNDNDTILLFTFEVDLLACNEGIRLWENVTDPPSGETCLGNFDNSFQMVYAAVFEGKPNGEIYEGNFNNNGVSLPKPTANPTFDCSGTEIELFANPEGVANCLGPLKFEWTGPNAYQSIEENPSIPITDAAAQSGEYSLTIIDANGCTFDDSFDITAINCFILPIELLSFDANKNQDEVLLNWVTANEINNDYFDIQRSDDGVNFTSIGTVKGAGSVQSESTYSFTDKVPNRNNYYRLMQVDFDGKNYFSELRYVAFEEDQLGSFTAYPNPFSNSISLTVVDGIYSVKIYSVTGELKVNSTFTAGDQISTSQLNIGTYIIKVEDAMGIHVLNQILVKS